VLVNRSNKRLPCQCSTNVIWRLSVTDRLNFLSRFFPYIHEARWIFFFYHRVQISVLRHLLTYCINAVKSRSLQCYNNLSAHFILIRILIKWRLVVDILGDFENSRLCFVCCIFCITIYFVTVDIANMFIVLLCHFLVFLFCLAICIQLSTVSLPSILILWH